MAEPDRLAVAICGSVALVAVHGRGTYKLAPALKQFGQSARQHGCERLVLDILGCNGMDSTFMGVMAGLAACFASPQERGVSVINAGDSNRALLATLGLDVLMDVYPPGVVPEALRGALAQPSTLQEAAAPGDRQTALETMIAAHEDLARVSPANRVRFQDVIEYLRRESAARKGPTSSPDAS